MEVAAWLFLLVGFALSLANLVSKTARGHKNSVVLVVSSAGAFTGSLLPFIAL